MMRGLSDSNPRRSASGVYLAQLPGKKNARATPCKQQRSASLAWPWDEPPPIGFFPCLVELLGPATIGLAGRKALAAAPWTVGRGVTGSTAVRVPAPTIVSTGSRMRC